MAKPASASAGRVRTDYAFVFALVHAVAALALLPYFFSWVGVAIFAIGVFIFGVLGINIGMHRMLSHRSFRAPKWFERTLATIAMCSAQETPARWVAWHRKHHVHSDDEHDPHSPRVGIFWSHFDWLLHDHHNGMSLLNLYDKYAKDIIRDPYYRWMERLPASAGIFFFGHCFIYAAIAAVVGWSMAGWNAEGFRLAASIMVWGVALRTVYVWHITWSVNSLTHLIGYRNYETKDDSRNSFFVALITMGEGWHNNHHSDPSGASVRHRWWEIDPIFGVIKVMGWLGLANNIVPARPVRERSRLATTKS